MKKTIFAIIMCGVIAAVVALLSGCKSMADAAKAISGDLGDKAMTGHAFVDIWKITPSNPTTNGSPTGEKITVIGDIKSIPLVGKQGETIKDYTEYRKTVTPAWYNRDNVTKEETFIFTGESGKNIIDLLKKRLETANNNDDAADTDSDKTTK